MGREGEGRGTAAGQGQRWSRASPHPEPAPQRLGAVRGRRRCPGCAQGCGALPRGRPAPARLQRTEGRTLGTAELRFAGTIASLFSQTSGK